jgi:hypothetical protein
MQNQSQGPGQTNGNQLEASSTSKYANSAQQFSTFTPLLVSTLRSSQGSAAPAAS